MTDVLTRLPDRIAFVDQQFEVDPDVNDLKKELKQRKLNGPLLAWWAVVSLFFIGFSCAAIAFGLEIPTAPKSEIPQVVGKAMYMAIGAIISCGFFPFVHGHMKKPEITKENKARRNKQKSLKVSVQVGRELELPVLTKEYVAAGLRLDELVSEKSLNWSAKEVEMIRGLLFSDLSREFTIFSIIEDRGTTTAEQVAKALTEMESNGKPLQGGWL